MGFRGFEVMEMLSGALKLLPGFRALSVRRIQRNNITQGHEILHHHINIAGPIRRHGLKDFNKTAAYAVKLSNLEITFHGLQPQIKGNGWPSSRVGRRYSFRTLYDSQANLLDIIFLSVAVLLL